MNGNERALEPSYNIVRSLNLIRLAIPSTATLWCQEGNPLILWITDGVCLFEIKDSTSLAELHCEMESKLPWLRPDSFQKPTLLRHHSEKAFHYLLQHLTEIRHFTFFSYDYKPFAEKWAHEGILMTQAIPDRFSLLITRGQVHFDGFHSGEKLRSQLEAELFHAEIKTPSAPTHSKQRI